MFVDSRRPIAGGLFVPIVAARDGHDFVDAAVEGGAAAVLWQRGRTLPAHAATVVAVADTLAALTQLARRRRDEFHGPVVSVSGSNGKTTTRAMIGAVLGCTLAPVLATQGNLNNHLGVPLTLLGEPHDPRAMVLELGMSAPGENDHLASIVRAPIHVVTSVALEHLEFMKTLAAIAAAEAEPLRYVPTEGLAVVPSDEPLLTEYLPRAHVLRCGPGAEADVRLLGVEQGERTRAEIAFRGGPALTVRLRLFGTHNARNATMALAVGQFLGVPVAAMIEALEEVEPVGDRGRLVPWGDHVLIADCYNANPGSVRAALESVAAYATGGPRIAVLGDMLELGPQERQLHADVGAWAAELGLDGLIAFGALAAAATEVAGAQGLAVHACGEDIEAAAAAVEQMMAAGPPGAAGVALIKGSRGMRLERLVQRLSERVGARSD